MNVHDNYFVLFGLSKSFDLNKEALASRYRELQRQYHPDRFAHHPEEQLKAVQWSSRLNTAYKPSIRQSIAPVIYWNWQTILSL